VSDSAAPPSTAKSAGRTSRLREPKAVSGLTRGPSARAASRRAPTGHVTSHGSKAARSASRGVEQRFARAASRRAPTGHLISLGSKPPRQRKREPPRQRSGGDGDDEADAPR